MDTMPDDDPMEKQVPLAGLDPAELLRQGAAEDTFMEGAQASFHAPLMEEIAAAFPQFEILGLIGRGGMGAVYKVLQKELDRIVALKILPPAIGQSPESSNRFTREARALAKLNHPGIVTIHEFGQQGGLFFILMEFVDGVNLAQLMKTGRVSPREALAIVPQVCDALQYAHDQGIVHRDIKPENLLLDRRGRVKVADFGIAKVVAAVSDPIASSGAPSPENQTLAGKVIGTPQYMAPEQIEHPSDVDHRADIYALGVVFYQMLTGELPGKDLQAPSRKFHIDVRLDEVVLKALEKSPELRYQTAGIFKTQLETIVSEMGSAVGGAGALPATRFSRTAIVGACWAPLILFAYIMWFSVSVPVRVSPGEEPPGPAWWQYLMMFTLLPLGVTAPFGTTILGWVSVSRIRRSAGELHGMWLAVFDGLLFPLLGLVGLIGWFWHWVFYGLIRATLIAGNPELSSLERIFVNNATAFTVLATVVSSMVAVILIIPTIWRAVNARVPSASDRPAPRKGSSGKAIAIGCGVLALGGIAIVGLGVLVLFIRYKNMQSHQRFLAEHEREFAEAVARAEQNEEPVTNILSEYDWKTMVGESRHAAGILVTEDGRSCLKIENPNDEPMHARLLTITTPQIKAKRYAVMGEIRYENVQGAAYLEMWSDFPRGRFFSRTMDEPGSGPTGQITGTSDWRPFILPFEQMRIANPPNRIEVNLHLPGRGVVYVGPLRLVELGTDQAVLDRAGSNKEIRNEIGKPTEGVVADAVETWLSRIDDGDYGRSWNEASGFFRKSITSADWVDMMEKLREPLGAVISRKTRYMKMADELELPGAPDGKYWIIQFDSSFAGKADVLETVTFMLEMDGTWKAAGYFIQ